MRNYNNMSYVCKCNVFLLELQIKSVDSRILSTNRQDLDCPREKGEVISEKYDYLRSVGVWECRSVDNTPPLETLNFEP